jgi:hypothetical protein
MQKRLVSVLENTTPNVCNFSILALLRINNWTKILWRYFCSPHQLLLPCRCEMTNKCSRVL